MKKCDFCSKSTSSGTCLGPVGGDACCEAAKAFKEYMIAAQSKERKSTNNININKNVHRNNGHNNRH